MTRKAEGRYLGGKRPIRKPQYTPINYHKQAKKATLPGLAALAIVSLHRYKRELLALEITREISGLVDCCDALIMANEGVNHDR